MVDASEFVDGASLDVRSLAGTAIGAIIVTVWANIALFYTEAASWFRTLVTSPIDAASGLLEQLLMIPGNSLAAANQAAADFFTALEPIGPLVWPLAMLITFSTMWAIQQILDRWGI